MAHWRSKPLKSLGFRREARRLLMRGRSPLGGFVLFVQIRWIAAGLVLLFAGASGAGAPRLPNSEPRRADLAPYGGEWDGPRWRVRHDRPIDVLQQAMSGHDAFSHVSIERANLETVFLHLTGRTLRD